MADRRNYLFLKGYDADVDDEAAAASLYSEDPGVIDDSQKSDDIFVGGHKTRRYEPRLRPWYKGAREFQNDFWTKPYVYADPGIFGITFARPLYYIDPSTGHKVFRGCIGVDHDLNTISDFLRSKFLLDGLSNGQRNQTEVREEDERVSSGNAIVLIVEDAEPYEIIGSSTDSKVFTSVLKTNPNIVCEPTDLDIDACDTTRLTPEEYAQTGNSSQDWIISTAFEAQKKQNFTRNLVKSLSRPPTESVSEEDYEEGASDYYVSQSLLYTPAIGGSFLQWRIIVAMPVEIDKDDAILSGDPMFVMVLVVTLTSSVCCLFLFYCYFRQRNRAEVAISDWRFTSAFLMGCAILNLTPLTYLGPITDAKCMAQMWALHLVFIIAMAPLLVKVWRIYKLVSSATRARRLSISNQKAMLFTLPFILFQVLMLTLASIFDPPRKENAVEISGSASIQRLFCGHQKHVFSITQAIYLGGLTICGCVLAYKSRNLGSSVGEAKQMFFAMYNIALVALIVMVSWYTLKIDNKSFYITMTLGICWGTVFSGAAFVLPRLLKIKENEKTNSERKTRLEISHDQSDN